MSRAELDEIAWAGYRREDVPRLAEALRHTLRAAAAHDAGYRGKAWRALARLGDPGDLPLLRQGLRDELVRDMGVAWQLMLALEEAGESILAPERGGGALWEEEENRRDAARYLALFPPPRIGW